MKTSEASVTRSAVINTQGLSKTYNPGKASTEVAALKSLDLKVPSNSIFGFLGPNGAGKTTAIKLLLGLARPTGGSVRYSGTISSAITWRSANGSATWPRTHAFTTI